MDAESFSCNRERGVFNAEDFTSSSLEMDWPHSKQNLSFFGSHFGRIFSSGPEPADSFTGLFRPVRLASASFMALGHMDFLRKPFKVLGAVIGAISVFVMDKKRRILAFKPAQGNHAMKKCCTGIDVAVFSGHWGKGFELSKNFPATRDSIKMTEESVFDVVYNGAEHGVPSWGYSN